MLTPTAIELLHQLREREVTSRQLTEQFLDRIAQVNPGLNAVVALDAELSLAEADRADARRRDGHDDALLGLPMTVKDNIDVAGLPCRGGSVVPRDVPSEDATVVARIRRAGAVVLGKTNLPEFGSSYESDNAVYGRTNHPLDPSRTPGGSSGGEGAIIAAGASPLGIGTDTGGSVRVPSHYCGIVGLRPTSGRVPTTGMWPSARGGGFPEGTCVGPMGRSVQDVALLLDVISGPDGRDTFTHPVPLRPWTDVDVSSLRVGWFVDDGVASADDATARAVETAADALRAAGASVVQAPPPDVTRATELFFRLSAADDGAGLRRLADDDPAHHTAQYLDLLQHPPYGASTSAEDLFALQGAMHELRGRVTRWFDDVDVVLAPVAAGPAPRHGERPGAGAVEEYGLYRDFNFCHAFSLAGVPAASVPVGGDGALPIGVQVVGAPWREDVVLAASEVIERSLRSRAP